MKDKNINKNNQPPTSAEENVKVDPNAEFRVVGVCFRGAGKSYWFAPEKLEPEVGDSVIVETQRGLEIGSVTVAPKTIKGSEIVAPLKRVCRIATEADLEHMEKNRAAERDAGMIFREKVVAHKLEMDLVSVEYTFDNTKLLFYYTAESRVDFRELVKDLAGVFKTRIELRQIGIRDKAKMVGGLGACGRPFCCSTFLSDFAQVSIKMAKEQNFSLNSSKISGTCGRLMCCLRYEHETYEEALRNTPSNGTAVMTPDGQGVVIETRPLAGQVKVRLDVESKDAPKYYPCDTVKVLRRNRSNKENEEIVSENEG